MHIRSGERVRACAGQSKVRRERKKKLVTLTSEDGQADQRAKGADQSGETEFVGFDATKSEFNKWRCCRGLGELSFRVLEQQDVYSPDCMAHMWKVAAQFSRESNEAQATIDDLKQLSTTPQQFDMQNVDLDFNCSDEFHCVHNSSCTISPALDLKSDFHSVNIDSVDLKEILYSGCDVTSEFNVVESNSDFNSEPTKHAEFVTDSSLINMGLGAYARANIVFDDLATEIKEDVDHESKSVVVVNEVECKMAENDFDEVVSEQIMQVYSELSIPVHISKVQVNVNSFDLLEIEPITPVIDTTVLMPAHTHILDSFYSVEHIEISIVFLDSCTDFEIVSMDDSPSEGVEVATEFTDSGKVVFEEVVEAVFEPNLTTGIAEMHTISNIFHALPDLPDTSEHFKMLDTIFVVHHTNTPTDGCSDLNACALDDLLNDYALTSNNYAKFDDLIVHINLDLDVADDTFSAGTDLEEAVYTEDKKEVLAKAGDGLNKTQGPWNVQNQQKLHEEIWLLLQSVLNVKNQQMQALSEELQLLQWRA
ncbi:hypothetical protein LR48_Vigan54s000700 [Vigna angularis]|uniref:Uncharacterized protein n=1 Tax=Phaseolus angularis TaxID=3914 RepID=A0A0L9T3M5_PHAAN|nr:hypothetical protein LR48_Vigan54s000700 [Vigna angularis]